MQKMHLHVYRSDFQLKTHLALWALCTIIATTLLAIRPHSTVLLAAVVPILKGLSGTLAVHDRGELRHDCAAVASIDI